MLLQPFAMHVLLWLIKLAISPSSLLVEDLHRDCCGMTPTELILSDKRAVLQSR